MFRTTIPRRRIQASTVIILLLAFLSISQPLAGGSALYAMQLWGGILITIAVLIRILSSIYIAGHKNRRLIIQGPYSLSRNPLYVCWLCGVLGMGLAVGSPIGALILGTVIFLIYDKAIRLEEERLLQRFPAEFSEYMRMTPRWLGISYKITFHLAHPPNFRLIIQTGLEGACLFLIYPLRLYTTYAQNSDLLPVLFHYF